MHYYFLFLSFRKNSHNRAFFLITYPQIEKIAKIHLEKGASTQAASSYLQMVKKRAPEEPVIHIDDSDVVKPDGRKFEALGIVSDGSKSTSAKQGQGQRFLQGQRP